MKVYLLKLKIIKMKKLLLLNLLIISVINLYSQNFTPIVISDDLRTSQGVISYDFNNDGVFEIINALYFINKVVLITKDSQNYVVNELLETDKPIRLGLADFNQDDKMDILVIPSKGKGIRILKNLGDLNFSTQTLAYFDYEKGGELVIDDFDNDGDPDIIISSYLNDNLTLFELTNPDFFSFRLKVIDNKINQAGEISSGDFDNNGTIDFISCSRSGGYSNIYLNDGNLNFTEKLLNSDNEPIGNGVGDLNDDGFLDILITSFKEGQILLYINNGDGVNYTRHIIDENIKYPTSIEAEDMDNDGDLDIIASYNEGLVIYTNNNIQNLNFNKSEYPIGNSVGDFTIIDFDNDGDKDIIASNPSTNTLYKFENDLISSVFETNNFRFQLSPNPVSNILKINTDVQSNYSSEIYNLDGKLILKQKNINEIDISDISNGIYLIKLKNNNSNQYKTEKIIISK